MGEQPICYSHLLEREAEDEKLKKTTRGIIKPLKASATGAQEPLNVECTFSSSLYVVCLMLELLLIAKSWLCLRAEGGVSLARAAASVKCGCVSQGVGFELYRLPGLDWVAQMREHLENPRFKILCLFRLAQLWGWNGPKMSAMSVLCQK